MDTLLFCTCEYCMRAMCDYFPSQPWKWTNNIEFRRNESDIVNLDEFNKIVQVIFYCIIFYSWHEVIWSLHEVVLFHVLYSMSFNSITTLFAIKSDRMMWNVYFINIFYSFAHTEVIFTSESSWDWRFYPGEDNPILDLEHLFLCCCCCHSAPIHLLDEL